jgi:uncharacterized membrane protein YeaQ/YmgE (transglycosylase-associated protein family)
MNASDVILCAVVGAVVGWLASQIMTKGSFGTLNDVLVGVAGGVIGGWLFQSFWGVLGGAQAPLLGHMVNASLGAVIATFGARKYKEYQEKA